MRKQLHNLLVALKGGSNSVGYAVNGTHYLNFNFQNEDGLGRWHVPCLYCWRQINIGKDKSIYTQGQKVTVESCVVRKL